MILNLTPCPALFTIVKCDCPAVCVTARWVWAAEYKKNGAKVPAQVCKHIPFQFYLKRLSEIKKDSILFVHSPLGYILHEHLFCLEMISKTSSLRVGIMVFIISGIVITLIACANKSPRKEQRTLPATSLRTDHALSKNVDQLNRIFVSEELDSQAGFDSLASWISVNTLPSFRQDLRATEAAETVRAVFNLERARQCASQPTYDQPGTIKYLIKSAVFHGNVTYAMEIRFGSETVFARVAVSEDPSGIVGFHLLSSTPGPCSSGVEDQLAVSFLGESMIHLDFSLLSRDQNQLF